jgi:hypothetical protein
VWDGRVEGIMSQTGELTKHEEIQSSQFDMNALLEKTD